jgi:hypothetical protein
LGNREIRISLNNSTTVRAQEKAVEILSLTAFILFFEEWLGREGKRVYVTADLGYDNDGVRVWVTSP